MTRCPALLCLALAAGLALPGRALAEPDPAAAEAEVDATASVTPDCPAPAPCPEPPPCPPPRDCVDCPRCAEPVPPLDSSQLTTVHLLTGVVAAAVAVPSAFAVGTALGAAPSNLIAAALPALLVVAVLPPVAVAGAEWLMGSWLVGDPGSLWWSLGSTALVHVGVLASAVALQINTRDLEGLIALSAAEALLLPTTAAATLMLTRPAGEEE